MYGTYACVDFIRLFLWIPLGMSSHLISFNPTQTRSEVVIAIVMIDNVMAGHPTPLTYHLQK